MKEFSALTWCRIHQSQCQICMSEGSVWVLLGTL
uniref:Uncharacterized protein n=1 Tax=Anguilla anguilla TaxID=7936 RepID=A0A0E9RU06_ANGAN